MKTPQEKYLSDPDYNRLVDTLYNMIVQCQFTPSELREASILASIKYEIENCRPVKFQNVTDLERALNIINNYKNKKTILNKSIS